MKAKSRRFVLALTVVIVCGSVFWGLHALSPFLTRRDDVYQSLVVLLGETDYENLRDACRLLSNRVTTGELNAGEYRVRSVPPSVVSSWPRVILKLEPALVILHDDGLVIIEMAGIPSFGVVAYPEGSEIRDFTFRGHRELIPGLWYYDEDYDTDPDLRQEIDTLIRGAQEGG